MIEGVCLHEALLFYENHRDMNHRPVFFALTLCAALCACQGQADAPSRVSMQSDYPSPPMVEKRPRVFSEFGHERIDHYYWLKDKSDPEVIRYLEAENAYAEQAMAHTRELREQLFEEMKGRIKEDDVSAPYFSNGYYYYDRTEAGKQYAVYCRKKGSLEAAEEILFDVNRMAEGAPTFLFRNYAVSPDNRLAAYAANQTGSYVEFELRVRDLDTGEDLPDLIPKVVSFAWANDNQTLFYTVPNEALRSYRVYKHRLGDKASPRLVYEESDGLYGVYVGKSKTNDYLFLICAGLTSNEYRLLPADQPDGVFQVFLPRRKDVEYNVEHHRNQFFVHYKDSDHFNYKVMEAPLRGFQDQSAWKELVAHDPARKIEGIEVFEQYLAITVRENGLRSMEVIALDTRKTEKVNFPEPVYTLYPMRTPEYAAHTLRYTYNSLNRPSTVFEYDMRSGETKKLKEQEIPSGFNSEDYQVERLWAEAADGVKISMAIVYRKGLTRDGDNPTLLYGYGSYGSNTEASFNSNVFSLVDRGFVYAAAQIRGGGEMGEQWYLDGKFLKKKNTFNDFIACAEHLVQEKYTNPKRLAILGGSAGGLLMGAVVNQRPDLFQAVVAAVPFVDVINTMLDTSLPLTTQEYEEWGDPNKREYYEYILSYSPYDNIEAKDYPHILATGGLNDSQVLFHEPAKWVAKLRAMKTDDNLLLLRTNMASGHGGASGRYDRLKERAFEYAFIIDRLGVTPRKLKG
jgi:oligopeptidase B